MDKDHQNIKIATALLCYNASTLLNIYESIQKILKIHPKEMVTLKKSEFQMFIIK